MIDTVDNGTSAGLLSMEDEAPQLNLSDPAPTLPDGVVTQRAAKVTYAYGDQAPDIGATANTILTGNEQSLREHFAQQDTMQFEQQKMSTIAQLAQQHGGNMSPEELDVLSHMNQLEWQSDPQTVFERKFAQKYTNDQTQSHADDPSSVYQQAGRTDPNAVLDKADIGANVTATNQYIQKIAEDLHAEYNQQGWGSTLYDFAGQLIQPLQAYRLHNILNAPGVSGLNSVFPGGNLGEQVAYARALPLDQLKAKLDVVLPQLKSQNMLTAMQFVDALQSYSSTDSFVNSAMNVAEFAPGGLTYDLAVKPLVLRGSKLLARNTSQGAVEEMQKAAGTLPEARMYTPEEIAAFKVDTPKAIAFANRDRTVAVPHFLSPRELNDIRVGLGIEEAKPRMFTAAEIDQMRNGLHVPSEAPVNGFNTDVGTFSLNKDGTTARSNRYPQQASGEVTPTNATTYYASPEDAARLRAEPGHARIVDHGDGTLSRSFRQDNKWTIDENAKNVPIQREPQVGLVPIELWNKNKSGGSTFYDKIGQSGPITSLTRPSFGVNTEARGMSLAEIRNVQESWLKRRLTKDELTSMAERINNWRALQKSPVTETTRAMADAVKAVSKPSLDVPSVLAESGRTSEAAQMKAAQKLTDAQETGKPFNIFDNLPSSHNPQNIFGTGSALIREASNRLIERYSKGDNALNAIVGDLHVPRGTAGSVQAGLKQAEADLRALYGVRINDGIIDTLHIPPELNPKKINADTLIMRLGNANAVPFTNRAEAELWMKDIYGFNPGEASIHQQGSSFYIHLEKAVDETLDAWKNALVDTNNTSPQGLTNMFLNRLRSANDLLSKTQNQNRNIATHAPQRITAEIRKQLQETQSALSRKEQKAVERVLMRNRDETDPATGLRGRFYTTAGDFEQAFFNSEKRLPSVAETAHYFNYTRLSDLDWALRNSALYRDKLYRGFEQFSWRGGDQVPWFEGKYLHNGIPWGGQNAGIYVVDENGVGKFFYKHNLVNKPNQLSKQELDRMIREDGYRVIQVADPAGRPLKDVSGVNDAIHFVVTKSMERKNLDFNQLPYRPGGHSIYRDSWYVKQPVIETGVGGKLHYYGDRAVMNFATQAEAKKWSEKWNTALDMWNRKDPNTAQYVAANLPYKWQDFVKSIQSGHVDPAHPMVPTYRGSLTFDSADWLKSRYPDVVDGTKSEYDLMAGMDKAFQMDRDELLNTVNESVFQIAPARQLDPYVSLNRGLGQSIKNLWTADYKIAAVQHWYQEFGDVMNPSAKQLSNNPYYFLYHPDFNEGAVDKAKLAAAKAQQRAIVNFVGAPDEVASQIQYTQQKLLDSIYGSLGQNISNNVADHLLPFIKDPATHVRAVAFHTKLGFFNPIQMWVQANTLAHNLALNPVDAAPGTAAGFLLRAVGTRTDQAIIDHYAGIASKLGWTENGFKEMLQTFQKTGLYEVAGEAALRDDTFSPKFFRSKLGAFLDKGTMFFNEGERSVRLAAFATSFRKWRKANPDAVIDNRSIGEIMNDADRSAVNMTRASQASWQSGIMSIPTQFAAYNIRMMEQFLGSRLTSAEKLRAFGVYSALYGVPTATGAVLGLYPFYDDVRQEALARGYQFGLTGQAITEGLLNTMVKVSTGHDYDIARRMGPGNNSMITDMFNGNKSLLGVIGGPGGSIIGDIWNTTDPVRQSIAARFSGDDQRYPLKLTDGLKVLNNISTWSLGAKEVAWYNYGKYVSTKGTQIGPMDGVDAIAALFGLTNNRIQDVNQARQVIKMDAATQKKYDQAILENYKFAIQSAVNNDDTNFNDYMSRVQWLLKVGDYNVQDRERIMGQANQIRPDLIDKIPWDLVRKSPASQYINRFDTFFKTQDERHPQ